MQVSTSAELSRPRNPAPNDEPQRIVAITFDSAQRFNDPFLIAVIYSSELVRAEFERTVQAEVEKHGWQVERLVIHGPEEADVASRMIYDPARNRKVFFVSRFNIAAPQSYYTLNFRREAFFDHNLRAVFWITENEVRGMMEEAADFWQIVRPIIELLNEPDPATIPLSPLKLEEYYWPQLSLNTTMLADPVAARQALDEHLETLDKLEERRSQTTYERAKLHYLIGALEWAIGSGADNHLGEAYHLAEAIARSFKPPDPMVKVAHEFLAAVICGRGNAALKSGYLSLAREHFQRAGNELKSPAGWLGMGHVSRLNRTPDQATIYYQKALEPSETVKLDPHLAWRAYFGLGQLDFARRKLDSALSMFEKAKAFDLSDLPTLGIAQVQEEFDRMREAHENYQNLRLTDYRQEAEEALWHFERSKYV
jgi:tetratricopeptide (TPR) repeat protein